MANNVQNEPGSVRAKRTNIKGAIAGMKVGSQLERTGCLTLGGIGFGWSQRGSGLPIQDCDPAPFSVLVVY